MGIPEIVLIMGRLRTLVMGSKELTEEEFEQTIDAISKAEKVLENRDEVKAECYETIELKLIPLGVSGIEDLLQDEVFETIDVSELMVVNCSIFANVELVCG